MLKARVKRFPALACNGIQMTKAIVISEKITTALPLAIIARHKAINANNSRTSSMQVRLFIFFRLAWESSMTATEACGPQMLSRLIRTWRGSQQATVRLP